MKNDIPLGGFMRAAIVLCVCLLVPASLQAADKVRATQFNDVAFGAIATGVDASSSQNLCIFSSSAAYSVTASGTTSDGRFALFSGSFALPYEVRWSDAPNATNGQQLQPGIAESGFSSIATQHFCNAGPPVSASLTVILRAADTGAATTGSYSGVLAIMIAPQ